MNEPVEKKLNRCRGSIAYDLRRAARTLLELAAAEDETTEDGAAVVAELRTLDAKLRSIAATVLVDGAEVGP